MSEIQIEKIKIKVSVVVILVDDYTDKIIPAGQAKVEIEGEKKPILKSDGYYVFTNVSKKDICVTAEMFGYQSVKLEKTISVDGPMEIIKLHLVPNETYNFHETVTYVTGKSKPYSVIDLVFRENQNPLRLFDDYEKKTVEKLRIYNPVNVEITDKKIVIESGSNFEVVTVLEKKENDYYNISEVLKNSYKKADTSIYVIHSIVCDENGAFRVPIPRLIEKNELSCEIIEKGKIKKKIKLEYGCVNEIK